MLAMELTGRDGTAAPPGRDGGAACCPPPSELSLRASIEAAHMAVWTWDLATGEIRCTNSRMVWGVDGTRFDDFIPVVHPDDRAVIAEARRMAVESGAYHSEYRVIWPDGRVRWIEGRGRLERLPDGGCRIVGGSFDITDRKLAEQARQESEQRWRNLFEGANDAIMLIDLTSGRYVDWNARVEQITGYSRDELRAMRMGDLASPAHQARVPEQVRRLHEQGSLVLDYEIRTKDGRLVPVELSARLVRLNDRVLMQAIGRDVSERRAAEQAVRRSEERLRLAVEATGLGTWDVDVPSATRRWSDEFYAILGLPTTVTPDPAVFRARIHPDDRDWVHAHYAASYSPAGDGRYTAEFRIIRGDDGRQRWVLATGRVFFDEAGRPLRGVGTLMDITERRQTEERLRLLLTELSHRVKNTLAVVQGIANQTLAGHGDVGEVRETLTRRLSALAHTHTLLTASEWQGASLQQLLQGELGLFGARVEMAGQDLIVGPKAALLLGLVIHELATNAVKHGALGMPEGRIIVRWGMTGDAPQELFRLDWQEHGGPPVAPPRRHGFGRTLIERAAAHELGGRTRLHFDSPGISYTLELPVDRLLSPVA